MVTAEENLLQRAYKLQQWNYSHGIVCNKSFKHNSLVISSDTLLVVSSIMHHADWPHHSKIIGTSTVHEHTVSKAMATRSNKFGPGNP